MAAVPSERSPDTRSWSRTLPADRRLSHYELLGVRPERRGSRSTSLFRADPLHHASTTEDLSRFEKELTAVFERLKIAYEALSDPERRRQYDLSETEASAAPPVVPESSVDPAARRELAAQSYRRARQLIEEKDYHPALQMLNEAVRFVPDHGEYRYWLGQIELKNANWVDRGLDNLKKPPLEPRGLISCARRPRPARSRPRRRSGAFARRLVSLDESPENQERSTARSRGRRGAAAAARAGGVRGVPRILRGGERGDRPPSSPESSGPGLTAYLTGGAGGCGRLNAWAVLLVAHALPAPAAGIRRPFAEILAHPLLFQVALVLFLLEFIVDKIPLGIASGTSPRRSRPVAGAFVAWPASPPRVAQRVGVAAAAAVATLGRTRKSTTRLTSTAATKGWTQLAVSLAEDFVAVVLATLVFFVPHFTSLVLAGLLLILITFRRRVWRASQVLFFRLQHPGAGPKRLNSRALLPDCNT